MGKKNDHKSNSENTYIWQCDIDNDYKWHKLCKLHYESFYYAANVVTYDERFIIFFFKGIVLLMDVNDYRFHRVNTMKIHAVECILHADVNEALVGGFIRSIGKENGLLIPNELVVLIKQYYISQSIHVINDESEHFKIDLNEILNADRDELLLIFS